MARRTQSQSCERALSQPNAESTSRALRFNVAGAPKSAEVPADLALRDTEYAPEVTVAEDPPTGDEFLAGPLPSREQYPEPGRPDRDGGDGSRRCCWQG